MFDIREDDLSGDAVRALVALHLANMHETTPPEHIFALDLSGLQGPDISFWSVWDGEEIVGMGAILALGDGTGELKSMRTHPDHLRRGVAAAVLAHLIAEARRRGYTRLSLQTGSGAAFAPALALYRKHGFRDGEAFADYQASDFDNFLHMDL